MTSIRKEKKRIKRDIAENDRLIAEYECKPATFENCFMLDALYKVREIQKQMLNELKEYEGRRTD